MDAFSLKKDNRKKFQDKQKLKRKHATPSDRKYRVLNRQKEEEKAAMEEKEQDQDQEHPDLKSNEDRYYEDPVFEDPLNSATSAEVNEVLKDVLRKRLQEDCNSPAASSTTNTDALKVKDLKHMGAAELNHWLGRQNAASITTAAVPEAVVVPSTVEGEQSHADENIGPCSADLPEELETDQDFLDGLL
ncbi:hypothetical protein SMKI_05G1120 [Saccharomyces mikatae IFO 1815]|uniref:YER034W-like protein n=1 Tax=Saccharomyces mikatae IFO 1815 TaxID=226126 RepID=A0AA35IZA4_SACMI|nr:uncharacterized protein SMKI_05G1120 [Saccharomyces mikatae IFO 1815]CAI4038501.1 hypothetical protein SMKI_05G1120 [Saccharomyces mikatae IFO 1815]